jgi:hypothetical protein
MPFFNSRLRRKVNFDRHGASQTGSDVTRRCSDHGFLVVFSDISCLPCIVLTLQAPSFVVKWPKNDCGRWVAY